MENIENFDYLLNDELINKMCKSYEKEGIECECVTKSVSFVQARKRIIAKINLQIINLLNQLEKTFLGMKNQYEINIVLKYKSTSCCIDENCKKIHTKPYINIVLDLLALEKRILLELCNIKEFELKCFQTEQLIYSIMQEWAIEYFFEYSKNGIC